MHGDAARYSESRTNPHRVADEQTAVLPLPMIGPLTGSSASAIEAVRAPALPAYLVRHYWWAYIWRPLVWFFDHQPIINTIVFGQYRKLTDNTLRLIGGGKAGDTLLIGSAYGNLIPRLATSLAGQPLTVVDVAPIQLERAHRKLEKIRQADRVRLRRMNAEWLAFADDSQDTSLFFLLLHELPDSARRRAVAEALRVTRPGGHLVLAEYGELTRSHWFHRLPPLRWIFGTAEPFLPSLWRQDLDALLAEEAAALGKRVIREEQVLIFRGFYRTLRYRIDRA